MGQQCHLKCFHLRIFFHSSGLNHQRGASVSVNKDVELVRACLSGEQVSARQLYNRYNRYVSRILFNVIGHADPVEDLVQETFLRVFRGLKSFQQRSSFKTWITRIAVNVGKNYLSSANFKKQRTTVPLGADGSDEDWAEFEPIDETANTENNVVQKEIKVVVDAALSILPEDYRLTVILWNEGFSYKEIADITGTNVKTVGTRIHYVLKKLRNILTPYIKGNNP